MFKIPKQAYTAKFKKQAVKEYVAGLDGKLTVHYLPGYAPLTSTR